MKIKDGSSDKKYFTMVPNFILNNSSAVDQALYLQMKRLVGDSGGICFASEKYFKDKLKIGSKALKSSLNYLTEHRWIHEEGYREVDTRGGVQKVKTYLVKDIWKMNMEFYAKGVSESVPLIAKGVSESKSRGVQKEAKGVAFEQQRRTREEEQEKNTTEIRISEQKLMESFKLVDPNFQRFFKRLNQWQSLRRMINTHGMEKMEAIINFLPKNNRTMYATKITSPIQLEENMGKLIAFWKQKKDKGQNSKIKVAIIL